MLPRHHRLTRPEDFRRTIRSGVKAVTPTVIVHGVQPSSETPGEDVRVGVTVSKAVGGSVDRHRVARQIRHAMAAQVPQLPAGSVWVIRALPGAGGSATIAADVGRGVGTVMESFQGGRR